MRTIARRPDPADELRRRLDAIIGFVEVKRDFQGLHAGWAATVVRIARGELHGADPGDTSGDDEDHPYDPVGVPF